MKFSVNKESMVEALQQVQLIVNPRTTLSILSNILIHADEDTCSLTTTDLEISMRTSVESKVSKPGASTIPARRIFSIFRELPSHTIEIDVNDKDIASIQCGSSFFKLVGISEDDFPPLPVFDECQTYILDQGVFKEMLQKTCYAASTDETRYILNSVLLSFKDDKLIMVATDGRRLALVEQEVEFPKEAEIDLILPSKTVNELIRALGDEGVLTIKVTAKQIAFEFNNLLIISKLIDGTYPNFRQVIPAQSEHRIAIEREELLTTVRRVALVTSDQSNSVKLTFVKNRLEITSITPDVGEARETLPVKYTGKEISISFNPDFLISPLKSLESDEVFMEVTDDLSPGVLKSNVPFIYVIMPMKPT